METTANNSRKFVDLVIETQSNAVDKVLETTKQFTKDIPFVNETLDKGNKIYKDTLQKSAEFIDKTNKSFNETTKEMNQNSETAKTYFDQWFENQMNWAKTVFNTNNNYPNFNSGNPSDWMNTWNNWVNQNTNNLMNSYNLSSMNQMMNNQAWNGFQTKMNDGLNQWSQFTKQYIDMMSAGNNDWWKQFSNLTAADSFKGMNQMQESLSKFYELWIPMFKNIQDKNFNLDIFKQLINPDKYKEFIDKFFHFMPEDSRKMMDQYNQYFIQYMKQMSESGLNNYNGFKTFTQNNPWMNTNPFHKAMEMYINWRNAMSTAVSPLSRLVEENSNVKQAKIWNDIYDQTMQFNIKNNELQYMMYQHGLRVMETVATNVAKKIQNGESVDSIIKIFQDWLMTGDEVYGSLFQSDEYSKLMTEVSSLQLRIKSEVDKQIEKLFFVHIPVATRTEMDEVYKNIYDLKKMYKNLERNLTSEKQEDLKPSKKK